MPWTDSRSRDEWLAEVQRRGTRIRRRRRVGFSVVGALALVLPVSLTATALRSGPERAVELSVAGPAPLGGMAPLPAPPNELATGEVPAAATAEATPATTIAEVHERVATINGMPAPRSSSPTSVPPSDDPVVGRSATTTTIATSGSTSSPIQGGALSAQGGAASASLGPALATCVAEEFRLTVSVNKSTYSRGEAVSGSSTLEKRSAGTCLLPDWWLVISLRDGAGSDLQPDGTTTSSSIADQHERWVAPCRPGDCPRPVEPGPVFSHTFSWELIDCTNPPPGPVIPVPPDDSHCVPFPPGTYTVVSDWTGPGSGSPARTTFQVGV